MSHAQRRAQLRYGIKLDTNEFKELRRQITEGEAKKIQRKSKNVGIYICILNSTKLIVVYHKAKKFFITVLPWSYINKSHIKIGNY